jgi:arginine:ornithine antiporter/lysine permease
MFMIYAGGLTFLLLSAVLYAPGTILFVITRREQGQRLFTMPELVVFAVLAVGCLVGLYGLVSGEISL